MKVFDVSRNVMETVTESLGLALSLNF